MALAVLPVPDLVTRIRIRRTARFLIACDPWPGMAATGPDAAQLALHHVLWLQRQTRRAVRSREPEAAVMLARVTIETTITGLYCLHRPDAVAQLQGESLRSLPLLLQFLTDADVIPASVLAECIGRLNLGTSAKGPTLEAMARHVDKSTGGSVAMGLYNRYYRPASTLTMHGGGAVLLLHVTAANGKLTRLPQLQLAPAIAGAHRRQLPGRAHGDGSPADQGRLHARREVRRQARRAGPDAGGGHELGRVRAHARPAAARSTLRRLKEAGDYIWSGRDADDPAIRAATVRAAIEALLSAALPAVPAERWSRSWIS